MRLEDMKNNIPETPEFIHLMIQDEVKKQLQDTKVINIRTGKKKMDRYKSRCGSSGGCTGCLNNSLCRYEFISHVYRKTGKIQYFNRNRDK